MSWYELLDEDRPPERIWMDDKALEAHFERVQERRRSGTGGGKDWESIPTGEFETNELTASLRK